jgi:hypothetical protein
LKNIQNSVGSGSDLPALPVAADTSRYMDLGLHQGVWNHLEIEEKFASGCEKSGFGTGKEQFFALNSFLKPRLSQSLSQPYSLV